MYLKFEMWLFRHPSNHKCGLQRNTISHHCPSTVISNKGIVLQKIKNLQSFFWNCKNIMFRNGWKNCKYKFFSVLQIFFCNYKKIIVSFIGLTTGCLEEVLERGVAKFELNYLFVCVLLLRVPQIVILRLDRVPLNYFCSFRVPWTQKRFENADLVFKSMHVKVQRGSKSVTSSRDDPLVK